MVSAVPWAPPIVTGLSNGYGFTMEFGDGIRQMWPRRNPVSAAAFALYCACIPAAPVDNPVPDAACAAFLPPPSNACLQGQCGNSVGVGQPCTKGGGECDGFNLLAGEAGVCTVDFSDNTSVACCTRLCSVNEECGENALCFPDPADPLRTGCVTVGCEGL